MMEAQFPILIVALPLIMSFVTFMVGIFNRRSSYYLTAITVMATTVISFALLAQVMTSGEIIRYHIGGWPPPWGIEYAVDYLNALMLPAISTLGLFSILHSRKSVLREIGEERAYVFYTLLLLQLTGLFGMTITSDVFNLYVLLEIASFSAYGLIAVGRRGAEFAAFRYMIFGTVGAGAYLLGVGYLYMLTGSLNMTDLSRLLVNLYDSPTLMAGFLFIVLGMAVKMALFPLHGWLPDAYSQAPSSASTILAPLFTKVGAYVLIRICFSVFQPSFSLSNYPLFDIIGSIVAVGIFYAGVMAIAQLDVRRMLCYVIVAEVGYIVLGLAAGNKMGFTGAILHLLYDMFMMTLLFTAWASIHEQVRSSRLIDWRGANGKTTLGSAVFILGGLSVIGIPPLCGFFSKWYIILGLVEGKKWFLLTSLLVSSLLNTICFFRVMEQIYLSPTEHSEKQLKGQGIPLFEGFVLASLSVFLVLLGLASNYLISFIEKVPFMGIL